MHWQDPDLLAELSFWTETTLQRQGLAVRGDWEQLHLRPWATAFRLETTGGAVWAKAATPAMRHEGPLVAALAGLRPDLLPDMLGCDEARGWLLTRDGGPSFRERHYGDRQRWGQALGRYAELQLAAVAEAQALVARDVPVIEPARLGELYLDLLADPLVLERLAPESRGELAERADWVAEQAAALAQSGLPLTVQHDDLHTNNVLVPEERRTLFFDWGDASISHPFFSLRVALNAIGGDRSEDEHDPGLRECLVPYLATWRSAYPDVDVEETLQRALPLAAVARAESWRRILRSLAPDDVDERLAAIPARWLEGLWEFRG